MAAGASWTDFEGADVVDPGDAAPPAPTSTISTTGYITGWPRAAPPMK